MSVQSARSHSRSAVFVLSILLSIPCPAAVADPNPGASLRHRYNVLSEELKDNQFGRPLFLDSTQTDKEVDGHVYAVVDYPLSVARSALTEAESWCDVLILHVNTKYCRATGDSEGEFLAVSIGRKFPQPIEDAHRVEFDYNVAASAGDYFDVRLDADEGPLNTSNYRIRLEAVSLPDQRTFLHLRYGYDFGAAARLATQAYLATTGRDLIGFTIVGKDDREPVYVTGMRGMVERNAMRYYLAIDAYLGALDEPPARQLEARLNRWFDGIASYPRQLLDTERDAYLEMKRDEYHRQQTVVARSR